MALFKRSEKPRPLGADHYYRSYWAGPDAPASHGSERAASGSPRPGA